MHVLEAINSVGGQVNMPQSITVPEEHKSLLRALAWEAKVAGADHKDVFKFKESTRCGFFAITASKTNADQQAQWKWLLYCMKNFVAVQGEDGKWKLNKIN